MMDDMVIFTRTFDLITWLMPHTLNFPRNQRFVITSRLQNALLSFQEFIVDANYQRGSCRAEKLRAADAELLKLRIYLRLVNRWGWLTEGQYHHVVEMVAEIGRLLGGWQKSVTYGPQDPL